MHSQMEFAIAHGVAKQCEIARLHMFTRVQNHTINTTEFPRHHVYTRTVTPYKAVDGGLGECVFPMLHTKAGSRAHPQPVYSQKPYM